MTVDFNDPKSIAAWVRVAPERNMAQLEGLRRLPLFQELRRAKDDAPASENFRASAQTEA